MFATMLRLGGQEVVFAPLQFKTWHELLQKHVTMEEENEEEARQTREVNTFLVEC